MRVVLGILAGCVLAGVAWWAFASGRAPARTSSPRTRPARDPDRLVLPPARDPAATTPAPDAIARRRPPGAATRLPVDVEVVGPEGAPPREARLHWTRTEGSDAYAWMAWTPPRTALFVEPGAVWLFATGGEDGKLRSETVRIDLVRGAPRPVVRLRLR